MLATAVANLHQVEKILSAVQALGRRHADYGVTAKHYEVVGEALLWTLHQGLGSEFTPAVKKAWTETYLTVSGVMQQAADDAFAEAA
jgi:hemoglobin-like flavoprotein